MDSPRSTLRIDLFRAGGKDFLELLTAAGVHPVPRAARVLEAPNAPNPVRQTRKKLPPKSQREGRVPIPLPPELIVTLMMASGERIEVLKTLAPAIAVVIAAYLTSSATVEGAKITAAATVEAARISGAATAAAAATTAAATTAAATTSADAVKSTSQAGRDIQITLDNHTVISAKNLTHEELLAVLEKANRITVIDTTPAASRRPLRRTFPKIRFDTPP